MGVCDEDKGTKEQPDYLTVKETAELLRTKVSHVRALVSRKQIPFGRVGRLLVFPRTVLYSWVRNPERALQEWFGGPHVCETSEQEEERTSVRHPVQIPGQRDREDEAVSAAIRLVQKGDPRA
jgi:excisionase family DNA binding protein